jgi:teichuronic acid biosynthesis glycosyltransferase TuaC
LKKNKSNIIYVSSFGNTKNSGIFFKNFFSKLYLKKYNFLLYDIDLNNIFKFFFFFFKLKLKIRKLDVLHSQYGSGCGFFVSLFKKNKKIITLRGSDILNNDFFFDPMQYLKSKLTLSYLYKFDVIIVVSHQIKNLLKNHSFYDKIIVIPDPVDSKLFYKISKTKAKKILKLDLKKFHIFWPTINDNNKIKNYELVKSISNNLEKYKDIKLIYANNKISFNKMYLYYNAVDCTILTSFYEGWPNVIKESIFCNTPVVTTNVSDINLIASKTDYVQIAKFCQKDFVKKILFLKKKPKPKNLKKYLIDFELKYFIKRLNDVYLFKLKV